MPATLHTAHKQRTRPDTDSKHKVKNQGVVVGQKKAQTRGGTRTRRGGERLKQKQAPLLRVG
eukprot:2742923-Prymnesium_polylepis.1